MFVHSVHTCRKQRIKYGCAPNAAVNVEVMSIAREAPESFFVPKPRKF